MIDPDRWFVIVTWAAKTDAGIPESEIRKRLCSRSTTSTAAPDWRPGQPTVVEDDGRVFWTVTFTKQKSPRGTQHNCFVVAAERYRAESKKFETEWVG